MDWTCSAPCDVTFVFRPECVAQFFCGSFRTIRKEHQVRKQHQVIDVRVSLRGMKAYRGTNSFSNGIVFLIFDASMNISWAGTRKSSETVRAPFGTSWGGTPPK